MSPDEIASLAGQLLTDALRRRGRAVAGRHVQEIAGSAYALRCLFNFAMEATAGDEHAVDALRAWAVDPSGGYGGRPVPDMVVRRLGVMVADDEGANG